MYFDGIDQVLGIAKRNSVSVFVVPDWTELPTKNAIILEPKTKSIISIEQVKEIIPKLNLRQTVDQLVLIRPADKLGLEAANALLKTLEEPGDNVHFALITSEPSKLLPTILSRSAIYFLRQGDCFTPDFGCSDEVKELAKKMITAKPNEILCLVTKITRKKDGVRSFVLEILSVAIEMLYKSYFLTEKSIFIKKIPNFLACYENISKNGNIKLQLIANLC